MRFLKNRILLLAIYTVCVTVLFLYFLFPSQLVQQKLESTVNSAGYL